MMAPTNQVSVALTEDIYQDLLDLRHVTGLTNAQLFRAGLYLIKAYRRARDNGRVWMKAPGYKIRLASDLVEVNAL
jgi:hypothetical protein